MQNGFDTTTDDNIFLNDNIAPPVNADNHGVQTTVRGNSNTTDTDVRSEPVNKSDGPSHDMVSHGNAGRGTYNEDNERGEYTPVENGVNADRIENSGNDDMPVVDDITQERTEDHVRKKERSLEADSASLH